MEKAAEASEEMAQLLKGIKAYQGRLEARRREVQTQPGLGKAQGPEAEEASSMEVEVDAGMVDEILSSGMPSVDGNSREDVKRVAEAVLKLSAKRGGAIAYHQETSTDQLELRYQGLLKEESKQKLRGRAQGWRRSC